MKPYNPNFKIGERVAYSAAWLRSVGAIAGELPFLRGHVVSVTQLGKGCNGRELVRVRWDGGEEANILNVNLARVGSPAMSAN